MQGTLALCEASKYPPWQSLPSVSTHGQTTAKLILRPPAAKILSA